MRRALFWIFLVLLVIWTAGILSAMAHGSAHLNFLARLMAWSIIGAPLGLFAYLVKPKDWHPLSSPKRQAFAAMAGGLLLFAFIFAGSKPPVSTSNQTATVSAQKAPGNLPVSTSNQTATVSAQKAPGNVPGDESPVGTDDVEVLKVLAVEQISKQLSSDTQFDSVWVTEDPVRKYVCGRISGFTKLGHLPVRRFMSQTPEGPPKSAVDFVVNVDANNSQFDLNWRRWCAPNDPPDPPPEKQVTNDHQGVRNQKIVCAEFDDDQHCIAWVAGDPDRKEEQDDGPIHGPWEDAPFRVEGDFTYRVR